MGDWESANGRLEKGAQWYAQQGWKILPVHGIAKDGKCTCGKSHSEPKEIGKHPAISSWNSEATSDAAVLSSWWAENPEYNVGVFAKPSGFLVIDIDPRNGGTDSFLKLEERASGALPPTVEAITGEYMDKGKVVRGRHLIYKCDPNEKFIGNFKKEGLDGIDVKHNGYILLSPSRHFSGLTYDWKPGHAPWEIEIAEAPEELLSVIRAKSLKRAGGGGSTYREGSWDWLTDLEFAGKSVDIETIMEEGLVEGQRAVEIYRLACALANKYGTTEVDRQTIESLMIRFNHEMVKPPMELEGQNSLLMHVHRAIDFVRDNPKINLKWEGLGDWAAQQGQAWAEKSQAEGVPSPKVSPSVNPTFIGDQISRMAEQGLSVSEAISSGNIDVPNDVDAVSEADGGRPGYRTLTDVGNGRRLIDTFSSSLRYTAGLGWFYWDGNYWKPDIEEMEVRELAKRVAAVIAGEVVQYNMEDSKVNDLVGWAKQAKSNTRLNNMLKSANSDPRILVGVEQWDGDSHLIGVANGVVDLRTGELHKGRPDLYITRRAPVAYTPGLRNVRWEQYIDFVTGGDKELQDWLQKAVGYSLTGLNSQDVLFLVYGPPGSGKTTFVETIYNALGMHQYAWKLDSAVLAAGDGNQNRSDEYHMAELRGRRMIWVDELPESERLKENKVKQLTGSGQIEARSPGGRPFVFQSQGKLWITTNHRPIITDDAMWRRLRPIPLTNIPEKPDPELRPYLSDPDGGLPAVLSWAVEGAIKYLNSSEKDPLGWCASVREAAEMYRKNEDRIGTFLEEETNEAPGSALQLKQLYAIYRMWSEERGERAMTQIGFQRKLSDRGEQIAGQGSRAEIKNRVLVPRAVSTGEVDWSMQTRLARL